MKTRRIDFNQVYARGEEFCKHGLSNGAIAYLPINYPVSHKIRVTELYARYKMYPVRICRNSHFPGLGICIFFIPFTHGLLGWYEKTTNREHQDFMQYWIHHKGLKQQEMIYKYPTK